MEVNQGTSEVSGHGSSPNEEQQEIIQTISHHHQQQAASRSYECNFCKKGFSNAQALGGHMNIHRKDKAKLKQASSSSSSKPSNNNNNNHNHNNNYNYYKPFDIMIASSRGGATTTTTAAKWHPSIDSWLPSSCIDDGSHNASELKQLPLFVEKTLRTDLSFHQDFQQSSSHGVAELDLELRLGHHVPPNKSSSSSVSMGTRKFF